MKSTYDGKEIKAIRTEIKQLLALSIDIKVISQALRSDVVMKNVPELAVTLGALSKNVADSAKSMLAVLNSEAL